MICPRLDIRHDETVLATHTTPQSVDSNDPDSHLVAIPIACLSVVVSLFLLLLCHSPALTRS